MLGLCHRYVRDHEVARDLMHDGFVVVFTRIAEYRGEGSFEGWLRKIFVNTALGYIRKNNKFVNAKPVDEMYDLRENGASTLDKMSASEILEVIGRMPAGYRTILNLYAVEGYSHIEISEMLEISESTSRSQYSRARGYLQKLLHED
jgi:RNA polymerase sigma-70 factor (ECF subfamily)